ncbi:UNVERIFIED_CONTAM: hypothetical protein RKD43_007402 [Streptomyces graminofaciens]
MTPQPRPLRPRGARLLHAQELTRKDIKPARAPTRSSSPNHSKA